MLSDLLIYTAKTFSPLPTQDSVSLFRIKAEQAIHSVASRSCRSPRLPIAIAVQLSMVLSFISGLV
jgi:hypothetical protein